MMGRDVLEEIPVLKVSIRHIVLDSHYKRTLNQKHSKAIEDSCTSLFLDPCPLISDLVYVKVERRKGS